MGEHGIDDRAEWRAYPVGHRNTQGESFNRCRWHPIGHHVQFGVRGVIELHGTIIMVVVAFLLKMHRRMLKRFM
ncbi:hypothetical protein FSY45_26660 [Comamonas sp. Z1]|uniref:Uncharacterized protein n=3 Tax=Comamonas TaxID=283 RepID=A0A8B4S693_COMTE|nr:hypothetical protein CtesDRAFT_PD2398 [Comamonas testosteroni KF-1]EHN63087.1 hypothetical protein CTATCC11996_24286 [Comamonas testosteroni ATCC 11996]KKI12424.1 hypothetical protein XA67_19600 [Comamonas thiooxydans]RDI15436.1 hypothetical protein DFO48_101714 [Comamonas sp. AG1104]TFF54224.1 hypothetical protein EIC84_25525 [Comamonas sp. A23]TYK69096.1 hypothetical protein FSY45_26660 [Comamonas sp. Z1]SUY77825.1 Uncharacterised protein [Comamonas testosteroni]